MRLIEALSCGIRGAENGTVEIYVRGQEGTFAQVFSDYDSSGAQTPTAGIALDAFGGAEVYVNQAVQCIAKATDGTVIRSFVAMDAATAVEVLSQSFTGLDYTTGVSAAGKPSLLSTVLDRWLASAGTVDWKVLVGGLSVTLQSAIGAASGLFFNVKDPAYGAKGDGLTDDRGAIQAACTAAAVVGGWVYFPGVPSGGSASYLVGAGGLSVTGIAGFVGPKGAVITFGSASQFLTVASPSNGKFEIIGLTFTLTTSAASWITQSSGDLLLVDTVLNCPVVNAASSTGNVINMTGSADAVTIISSTLTLPFSTVGSVAAIIAKTVAFLYAELNCVMNGSAVNGIAVQCTDGAFTAVDFSATNSLRYYIDQTGAGQQALAIMGTDFGVPSSGSVTGACIHETMSEPRTHEWGNSFHGQSVFFGTTPTSDVSREWPQLRTLERNESFQTNDTASVDLRPGSSSVQQYGMFRLQRTSTAAQTVNWPVPLFGGQELLITYINDSGGTLGAITIAGNIKGTPAWTGLTVGQRSTVKAQGVLIGGTMFWVCLPAVVYT